MRRSGQRLTEDERPVVQDAFLKAFAATGNMLAACTAAKVGRTAVYGWLEHDEAFTLRYHQAEAEAVDVLEGEAWRRAVHGVEKPVTSMGRLVLDEQGQRVTVREYSDGLLIKLLAARHPKYGDKQRIEISGPDGGAIEVRQALAEALHDRKITEQIHRLLERVASGDGHAGGSGLPRE